MQRHPREGWKAARQVMMEARTGRPVTRRDFLKTSAGAGIALPSLAAIMAACTNPRDTSPDNPSNSAGKPGKAAPDNPVTLPPSGARSRTACRRRRAPRCSSTTGTTYMWKKIVERVLRPGGVRLSNHDLQQHGGGVAKTPDRPVQVRRVLPDVRRPGQDRARRSPAAAQPRATSRTSRTCGRDCRTRSTTRVAVLGPLRHVHDRHRVPPRRHLRRPDPRTPTTRCEILWDPQYNGKGRRSTTPIATRSRARCRRSASRTSTPRTTADLEQAKQTS